MHLRVHLLGLLMHFRLLQSATPPKILLSGIFIALLSVAELAASFPRSFSTGPFQSLARLNWISPSLLNFSIVILWIAPACCLLSLSGQSKTLSRLLFFLFLSCFSFAMAFQAVPIRPTRKTSFIQRTIT